MNIKLPVFKKNVVFCVLLFCSVFLSHAALANTILKNNFFIKGSYEEAGLKIKYTGVLKFFMSSETRKIEDIAFNYKLASFYIEEVTYKGKIYRGHDLFGVTFPYETLVNLDISSLLTYKGKKEFKRELALRSNKYEMFSLTNDEKEKFKSLHVSYEDLDKGLGFKFKLLETVKITKLFEDDLFVSGIIDQISNNEVERSKKENENEYVRLLTEGNIRLSENNYEQALFSFLKAKKYASDDTFVNDKIDIVDSYLNRSRSKFRWKNRNEETAVALDPLVILKNELKINASFDSFSKEKAFYKLVDKADNHIAKGDYDKAINELNQSKKYTNNKIFVNNGIAIIKDKIKEQGGKKPSGLSLSEQARKEKERKEKEALFKDYKKYSAARKSKSGYKTEELKKDQSYADLLKQGGQYLKNKEYAKSQQAYREARKKTKDKSAVDRILTSIDKLAEAEQQKQQGTTVIVNNNEKAELNTQKNKKVKKQKETKDGYVSKKKSENVGGTKVKKPKKAKEDKSIVAEKTNSDLIQNKKKSISNETNGFDTSVAQKNRGKNRERDRAKKGNKTTTVVNKKEEPIKIRAIDTIESNTIAYAEKKKKNKKRGQLLSFRKGFIKYKRDEQAVVDSHDAILIPFGKYKIMYYRAGFARIKLKDSIALKTVECAAKNEEYSWSARVYQNPWFETVINDEGEYVDEVLKKVEIYVVDNVSLLPYEELSDKIIEAYKDPNPYEGTGRISAHNLWNRKHSDEPEVIKRRADIARYKQASKLEAYQGADRCREK
ncbi:hypothetical protein, partial [Aquimarina agarilytica]|uniref:hypothetical protein n=1 Tax=Aquimarina agarilytica TaxID=1087449 RepID=UPI0002897BEA